MSPLGAPADDVETVLFADDDGFFIKLSQAGG
jgi:hypothetical protein